MMAFDRISCFCVCVFFLLSWIIWIIVDWWLITSCERFNMILHSFNSDRTDERWFIDEWNMGIYNWILWLTIWWYKWKSLIDDGSWLTDDTLGNLTMQIMINPS
jgi:hypothetical protein